MFEMWMGRLRKKEFSFPGMRVLRSRHYSGKSKTGEIVQGPNGVSLRFHFRRQSVLPDHGRPGPHSGSHGKEGGGMKHFAMSADTNDYLPGRPTKDLIRASLKTPEGFCDAYRIGGWWYYSTLATHSTIRTFTKVYVRREKD